MFANSLILIATAYPIHVDAFATYLRGSYRVEGVTPNRWQQGLYTLQARLARKQPAALAVDDTFPHTAEDIAACVAQKQPYLGMIFLDAEPNIFRVLHYLDQGFSGYLYLGDDLSGQLRSIVDAVRRGERALSPSIRGLYDRYTAYCGLFNNCSS